MAKIRCGFAQCDITPAPYETFQDGYGSRLGPATAIRDKIYAKVCSVESCGDRIVFISVDVCGFDPQLSEVIKDAIKYYAGVTEDKVALCATHTHTGPACGVLESCPKNMIYWYRSAETIAKAVKTAMDNETDGAFEFKLCDKPLETIYNRVGRQYCDHRVRIAVFTDTEKNIKGVIAHGASHPTVLGDMMFSGDYPGIMTRNMGVDFPGVPVVYLNGRGGDTNPLHREKLPADYLVNKLGTELSDSIKDGIEKLSGAPTEDYDIKSAYNMETIPRKAFLPVEEYEALIAAEYKKYFETTAPVTKRCIFPEIEWLKMCRDMAKEGKDSSIKAPLQVFKLNNDAIFAFIPFELLCVTGNTIEEKLVEMGYKRESIFVIGYANQVLSYLAAVEHFDKGGYDIGGAFGAASHWYKVPDCSKETEGAVIDGIMKLVEKVK